MSAFGVLMNVLWVVGLVLAVVLICLLREARESHRMIEQIRLLGDRERRLERQIQHMALEGFAVARIARELRVSPNTVKALMDRLHEKEGKPRG